MFHQSGKLHVHFSIPFYAGDQLIRSLGSVAGLFSNHGISIPAPDIYRPIFGDKVRGQDGGQFTPMEITDLSAKMGLEKDLVILSFNDFLCVPNNIFEGGVVYKHIVDRISYLKAAFPNREIKLFFSAASPAAIMCALINENSLNPHLQQVATTIRPLWMDMVEKVKTHHPEINSVIWATEDTPATWPVVLRTILDRPEPFNVPGSLSMAAALLDDVKKELFQRRLDAHAPKSEKDLVMLINEFIKEHADPELLSFEVDIPGWTQDIIDDFELLYQQDIDFCADIDGTRVITLETELFDR